MCGGGAGALAIAYDYAVPREVNRRQFVTNMAILYDEGCTTKNVHACATQLLIGHIRNLNVRWVDTSVEGTRLRLCGFLRFECIDSTCDVADNKMKGA